jgi:DNA-binding NtrC family response regulator
MDKWKILVVGELNQVGGFISTVFNKKGFDATVVDSSRYIKETCVEIYGELSRKNYDMVLLTNNGLSPNKILNLIPEIKKKHPAIKIFVLSGFNTPEFIKDLEKEGIDDFLPMPFTFDDLMEKVTSIFIFDQQDKLKEAQKKLDWAKSYYNKEFECEVTGYDRHNYRVRFGQEGRLIAIESIPRNEIDDLELGGRNSPSLKELFGWVEQVTQGKGKS